MAKNLSLSRCGLLLLAMPLFAAENWRPVTNDELTQKESKIDPKADAEILLKDVRIEKGIVHSYFRYKIYTERGREKYSDVKLQYRGKPRLSGVAARTIHADGTAVELADGVFHTIEAQRGKRKEEAVAFTLPAVEVGSIVEYRWQDDFENPLAVEIQDEVPVVEATVRLAPEADSFASLYFTPFYCKPQVSAAQRGKHYAVLTLRNVEAYAPEPFSPPRLSNTKWIQVSYRSVLVSAPYLYWNAVGERQFEYCKGKLKLKGEIRKTVADIVQGKSEEERLTLLAAYCRKNIKSVDADDATTEERERAKNNKTVSDALERHAGTADDVTLAFVALAQAAGFDARPVLLAGRRSFILSPDVAASASFLTDLVAAVSLNGKWRYYNVRDESARRQAFGVQAWRLRGFEKDF